MIYSLTSSSFIDNVSSMKQTLSACEREVPNTSATHSYSSRTVNCIHFVNFKIFINNRINISLELIYFLLSMEGSDLLGDHGGGIHLVQSHG